MAVRYSGDLEITLRYDPQHRAYVGSVRGPRSRYQGVAPARGGRDPRSSEAFDQGARDLLARARSVGAGAGAQFRLGRPVVSRLFEAPCPTGADPMPDRSRQRGRRAA
jgi:hypothetical protein